jgi:hypothetical protein
MNEDRRMGQQLYAGEEEAYGSLDEFNQRNALKKLSCRCAPDLSCEVLIVLLVPRVNRFSFYERAILVCML